MGKITITAYEEMLRGIVGRFYGDGKGNVYVPTFDVPESGGVPCIRQSSKDKVNRLVYLSISELRKLKRQVPEEKETDSNKERVGVYLGREGIVRIEGPERGLYRKVDESGKSSPLGTVVTKEDIKGLKRISS